MTGIETDRGRSERAPRGRGAAPAVALVCAYLLLLVAWVIASPPFSALDEGAHYLRALGLGQGQLVGERTTFDRSGDLLPAQYDWLDGHTRIVTVPAGRAAYGTECDGIQRFESAACLYEVGSPNEQPLQAKTFVGSYGPLPYLLPGLAAVHLSDHWRLSLYLARAASVLVVWLFLVLAVLLLYGSDRRALSLVGLVMALTPMTLFVASGLNPSGLEIAASVALIAALLRLTRPGQAPVPWLWVAAGVSALALALSRQTGPVWLIADVLVFVGIAGPRRALSLVRAGAPASAFAAACAAGGIVLNRVWEAVHQPSLTISLSPLRQSLLEGLGALGHVFRENVGIFGSLAVPMPFLAYAAWWAAFFALAGAAWSLGPRRERWLLAGLFLAAAAAPVVFHAAAYRHSGFGLQGRYFLPFLVAVPLVAGEIVYRARARLELLNAQWLVPAVTGLVAAIHLVSWYWAARRAAVGVSGPVVFPGRSEWAPPGGWPLPALLAAAGAVLLVAALTILAQSRRPLRLPRFIRLALPRRPSAVRR